MLTPWEWRQLRLRLLKRCVCWGVALPVLSMALSFLYIDSFEQRVMVSALFVAAGFFGVAVSVGPGYGFLAGLIILVGALMGVIALSWAVAVTVAMIAMVKLNRLNKQQGEDPP